MKNIKRTFPNGKMKAFTLSYDDGVIQDRRFVEIINKYGLKSAFHLNSGSLGVYEKNIKAEEVPALYKGHEISMHTLTHPYLERLSNAEVTAQVFEDKKNLEKLAGYPVTGLSYPFGTYDRNVAGLLRAMGVEYARTVHSTGEYRIPDDFLVWNPTCHHNKLCEHTEKFKSLEARVLAVLYCWGHTYEFDNQGNWSQIEEQFKSIAGQDDIWYATNIEICRYVKAGKSLVVSADGETAYNGSALSVWVEVDRKIYEIKSGGTVCFG